MIKLYIIIILFALYVTVEVSCFKYLLLHPFYSGSHILTLHSLTEKLIQNGHSVTTVRFKDVHNLKLKNLGNPNHTEIIFGLQNSDGSSRFLSHEKDAEVNVPMDLLWQEGLSISTLSKLPGNPWALVKQHCNKILGSKSFLNQLKEQNFDVAIVDLIFNECSLALAHHLGIPTAGYWAMAFSSGECEFPAVSTPPSYIPAFMSELTDSMTFFERVYNFLLRMTSSRLLMYFHAWMVDAYISQHLENIPGSLTLLSSLNGALINSDSVIDYPKLKGETMINIGGLQIKQTRTPLPQKIQTFIDESEHGIILFSMGFIFNPSHIPKKRILSFLKALSSFPQRVIMKTEEPIPGAPKNVLTLPFLPQQDILAHPKTKAFFTHCGMHGVMEAIYFGVPMIGMPIFADQGDVSVKVEQNGIGIRVSKMADEETIASAIKEVLTNSTYKNNILKKSILYRKRRNHPMEDALWLVEYLAETNGAKHMIPAGKDLNFIVYHSVDVVLFLIFVTFVLFGLTIKLFCIKKKSSKHKKD